MDRLDLWASFQKGFDEPTNGAFNGKTVKGMPLAFTLEVSLNGTTFTKVGENDTVNYDALQLDNKFSFDNQEVKAIRLHITRLNDNQENGVYFLKLGELAAYNINGRPADVSTSEPSSSEESSAPESSAASSNPTSSNDSGNNTNNSNNTNNGANSDTANSANLNSSTANSPATGEAPTAVAVMAALAVVSAGILVLRKKKSITI
jgi:LPXTG-motif cell wall-anchored protein